MTVFYLNTNQSFIGPGQIVPMTQQAINGGPNPPTQTIEIVGSTTSGNIAATVQVQGSNDSVNWQNAGTAVTISGTSPQLGMQVINSTWQNFRANVTSITGTGATVTTTMAV